MLPAPHAGVGWLEKPAREPSVADSAGAPRKADEAEIDVSINKSRGSIAIASNANGSKLIAQIRGSVRGYLQHEFV